MTDRWKKIPVAAGLALVLAAGLVAAPAAAASEAEEVTADAAVPTVDADRYRPINVLGMQVWIDEETGAMRTPTAEESARLSAQMQKMFGQPQLAHRTRVVHRDGMTYAEVPPQYLDYTVVWTADDGSLASTCVDSLVEAETIVETGADSAPEGE